VLATNLAVLRWPRHEPLALQACHPRFSATHRYIAYGRLVAGDLRGDRPLTAGVLAFR
jgi:sortase (surface protein transpeptidase)